MNTLYATHRRELGMAVDEAVVAQKFLTYEIGEKLIAMNRSAGLASRYVYYIKMYQEKKVDFLPTWLFKIMERSAPPNIVGECYSFASFVDKEYEFMNQDHVFFLSCDMHMSLLGAGCNIERKTYSRNWPLKGTPAIIVDVGTETREGRHQGTVRVMITRDSAKIMYEVPDIDVFPMVVMVTPRVMYHLDRVITEINGYTNIVVPEETCEGDMLCYLAREFHVYHAPKTVDDKKIDVIKECLKEPVALKLPENQENRIRICDDNFNVATVVAKLGTTVSIAENLIEPKKEENVVSKMSQRYYKERFCELLTHLSTRHPVFSAIEPIVIKNVFFLEEDSINVEVENMPEKFYSVKFSECEDTHEDNYCLYLINKLVGINYRGKSFPELRFYDHFCELTGVLTNNITKVQTVQDAIKEMYGTSNSDAIGTVYRPARFYEVEDHLEGYHYAEKKDGIVKMLLGFNGIVYLVSANYNYEVIGLTSKSFLCDVLVERDWIWVQDCLYYLTQEEYEERKKKYHSGYVRLSAAKDRLQRVCDIVHEVDLCFTDLFISEYGFKEMDEHASRYVERGNILLMSPNPYVRGFSTQSYNCSHSFVVRAKAERRYHEGYLGIDEPEIDFFVQDEVGSDILLTAFPVGFTFKDSQGKTIVQETETTASIVWCGQKITHHDTYIDGAIYECQYNIIDNEWVIYNELVDSRYDNSQLAYWIEMMGGSQGRAYSSSGEERRSLNADDLESHDSGEDRSEDAWDRSGF